MKGFFFIILLTASQLIIAQSDITIKFGYVSSNLEGDSALGLSSRSGIRAGYSYRHYYSEYSSFDFGLTYSGFGAMNRSDTNDIKLHYFDIPLDLRLNIYYGLILQVGLEPAILLGSKIGSVKGVDVSEPLFIPFDLRYSLGIGYEHVSGFGVDLYYKAGVFNIGAPYDVYNSKTYEYDEKQLHLKNYAIILTTSYTFK